MAQRTYQNMIKQSTHFWILCSILLVVVLIYQPGLKGPFVLDDGENISFHPGIALKELNANSIKQALLAGNSGPLKRPLASISFALNHYFAGGFDNTLPFKVTNLAIHAITTILIYFLAFWLTRAPALAALTNTQALQLASFSAALWAIHPIQLTNVLYVVQRMNSLSALFVVAGLLTYVYGRQLLETQRSRGFLLMSIGVFAGMMLGLTAKENAVLLSLFALTIEFVFFKRAHLDIVTRRHLFLLFSLALAIPAILFLAYIAVHPDYFSNSYALRSFSVSERLLTEMRILWYYIHLLVIPSVNELGLFHDDITLSTNLFTPYTTFLSVAGILALLIFALIKIKRYPIISFAILWFLAGHLLESTVFSLELVYEHRNYLPSFSIVFALCYFLISRPPKANSTNKIWILLICATTIMLGFATWSRANTWKDAVLLAESMAERHPLSPRANDFASRVVLAEKNDIFLAVRYTLKGLNADPREVGFYLDLRILLATLAAEINDGLARTKNAQLLDTFSINVQGLPEGIESKAENNEIHLVYHKSTDAQIHQLLKTQPISVHGIVSLENLSRCILSPSSTCRSLENIALTWFSVAAENPRTSTTYRSIMQIEAAKLYARTGDNKRALDYASQAMDGSPNMPSYQLAKTEYLIRLGRLAEARTMLDRFEKTESEDFIQYSANKITLEKLSRMYEKAIKTKTGVPSGMK